MAYEIELWESENSEKPHNAGESRVAVSRISRLENGPETLAALLAKYTGPVSRVTLSDTRGTFWDIKRYFPRDKSLDSIERTFSDMRPAGAAKSRPKKRVSPQ